MKQAAVTLALLVAVLTCLGLLLPGTPSTATPTHAAAVFFDGIDRGDYRQTCQNWVAGRRNPVKCEAALTMQMAQAEFGGMFGGYKIVPHSEKEWRQATATGSVELATVKVEYAPSGGQTLTAHLKKLRGRWLVWFVV